MSEFPSGTELVPIRKRIWGLGCFRFGKEVFFDKL